LILFGGDKGSVEGSAATAVSPPEDDVVGSEEVTGMGLAGALIGVPGPKDVSGADDFFVGVMGAWVGEVDGGGSVG
jgi:hypothetical protein